MLHALVQLRICKYSEENLQTFIMKYTVVYLPLHWSDLSFLTCNISDPSLNNGQRGTSSAGGQCHRWTRAAVSAAATPTSLVSTTARICSSAAVLQVLTGLPAVTRRRCRHRHSVHAWSSPHFGPRILRHGSTWRSLTLIASASQMCTTDLPHETIEQLRHMLRNATLSPTPTQRCELS